jgi:hypothetical protein
MASFGPSDNAMYSDSVLDRAIQFCFFLLQDIAPPLDLKINPEYEVYLLNNHPSLHPQIWQYCHLWVKKPDSYHKYLLDKHSLCILVMLYCVASIKLA